MNLIEIKDLYENKENFIDKEIEVGGWVRSIRDSKTNIQLRMIIL